MGVLGKGKDKEGAQLNSRKTEKQKTSGIHIWYANCILKYISL